MHGTGVWERGRGPGDWGRGQVKLGNARVGEEVDVWSSGGGEGRREVRGRVGVRPLLGRFANTHSPSPPH